MRLIILLLIALLSFNLGNSQIEKDKALHFAGGALFGLAGAGIAKEISNGDRYWTFAGAVGGALLIGLGKEAIDSGQEGNQWDNGDVLATVLGGVAVGFTIDIFTKKKKKKRVITSSLNFGEDVNLIVNERLPTLNELRLTNSLLHTE
ncbi:hypothetical protein MTsPCn9_12350 [Croceitalea sp. MTPC9]|uniref:hypothetical protein n=1 Tax=unclassified Croceitalea TaxID=2632280 RepID=UPI002B3A3D65|nr:hypothetical protein MTsPCn6_31290 [Croceitalea sp. MTPC6]GMN16299.1 hypothetical protein MTsPCn9_12350 [Croceitalea sp. MTPC9]